MPELWPECAPYLEAFFALSPARPFSMGAIGYIPIGEMVAYATLAGIEDVETLFRHVRALDGVFVAHWHAERERNANRRPHERP